MNHNRNTPIEPQPPIDNTGPNNITTKPFVLENATEHTAAARDSITKSILQSPPNSTVNTDGSQILEMSVTEQITFTTEKHGRGRPRKQTPDEKKGSENKIRDNPF